MKNKFLTGLLTFLLIYAAAFSALAATLTPSEARKLSSGSEATVSGYAASAHCNDLTGFENEFYLYSGTNGICVTLPRSETVTLYENLEITGTVTNEGGEIKLICSALERKPGKGSELFKRVSVTEACNYEAFGGSYVRLIGTAEKMYTENGVISAFDLSDGNCTITVIIESGVESLSSGYTFKKELTEILRYKREVVVNGFVSRLNGKTVIRIKDCDDIDIKYHACVFGDATTQKEPSCGVTGLSVKKCFCGKTEETLLPALEHSFKDTIEIKATCTSEGLFVRSCKNCSYRAETTIEKTEHRLKEVITKKPTCTAQGTTTLRCTECSFERTESTPALPHKYESATEKATFKSSGKLCKRCSLCSHEKDITIIPAVTVCELSKTDFVHNGKKHTPEITVSDSNKNKVTSFTASYSESISIGTHSVTVELFGNYSGRKTLSYRILPADVTSASYEVSGKTVSLSFAQVKGADGYRIFFYDGDSLSSLKTTESASCNVTLPHFNSTYNLVIKAYTRTDNGIMWSNGYDLIIKTAPEKASGVKTDTDFCSLRLSWNKCEGALGYRVYVKKSNGKYKKLATISGTSYEVLSLSGGKNYTFAIKPYGRHNNANLWGEPVFKDVTIPNGKVSTFSADESYYSVKLSWRSVKNADGYRLYIYNEKKKKYSVLAKPVGNTFTAADLNSGTTYRFAVRPFIEKDGKIFLGQCEYLKVTTKLKKPALSAFSKSSDKNSLSWNKINGASGYEVYYSRTKDGKFKKLKTLSSVSFVHSGIAKTCYYKVRAYKTVDGKKLYSSFSTAKKVIK